MEGSLFTVLDGLPAYGPVARGIPADWGRRGHEGFVVRFTPSTGPEWTGNFAPGLGGLSGVYRLPGGERLLVASEGEPYLVDPSSGTVTAPEITGIMAFWDWPEGSLLIVEEPYVRFAALDHTGLRWRTQQLSWDGFRNVRLEEDRLLGESYTPVDQDHPWVAFTVDLHTGRSTGGAYTEDDARHGERLATPPLPPN